MNIFEIFCAGDGRINEPNMSSALHFLLSQQKALESDGYAKVIYAICSPMNAFAL